MAKTIPQLTDATTVNATDELIVQQGGITKRATGAELAKGLNTINGTVNVKDFGAVGDGSTDDTTAIQLAINTCSAKGGGIVELPPTGAAYRIFGQLSLPNGVVLKGQKAGNFNGATGTIAQWTNKGTWIHPSHASLSAIRVAGHGAGVSGINFIHSHATPTSGWTPTVYGWTIEVSHSHTLIEDVCIVNGYNGIWFNYTTGSGGGTIVRMRDVIVSAFNERLKTTNVNDTMYWSNIHCRNLWYSSDSDVVSHIRANTIGWRCGYTDNIMVDGIEFFEDRGILFEDGTCLGITHSLYNGTLSNVQFNLGQRSLSCATTSTTVWFKMCNVLAQQGNAFGLTWGDRMFSLDSDNVNAEFIGLTVNDAGGEVLVIGNGSGGHCLINGLWIKNYSTISAGQTALAANAGSTISLDGVHQFVKPVGAGARLGGAGVVVIRQHDVSVFPTFSAIGTVTGTGASTWADISTNIRNAPNMGFIQARLVGQVYVSTAVAAGTLGLRVSNYTSVGQTGIDASAVGWVNIDTNFVDITGSSFLGRVQFAATSGVQIDKAELNVVLR